MKKICVIKNYLYLSNRRAVRRFVYENHGLMRRMYGDERHISVLRSEIETNDVEYHSDSDWSFHDSKLSLKKNYQPRTESAPKSSSTTTTTTTTAAPEARTRSTTSEPVTENASAEANTNTSTEDPYTLASSEFLTTEVNIETTAEYETTTTDNESEKAPPVHQHQLFEKDQTTTEEPQLYKLRGV